MCGAEAAPVGDGTAGQPVGVEAVNLPDEQSLARIDPERDLVYEGRFLTVWNAYRCGDPEEKATTGRVATHIDTIAIQIRPSAMCRPAIVQKQVRIKVMRPATSTTALTGSACPPLLYSMNLTGQPFSTQMMVCMHPHSPGVYRGLASSYMAQLMHQHGIHTDRAI